MNSGEGIIAAKVLQVDARLRKLDDYDNFYAYIFLRREFPHNSPRNTTILRLSQNTKCQTGSESDGGI